MIRPGAVLALLCSGAVAAAENPLPAEAAGVALNDRQKQALTHFEDELEPSVKAMHAACGALPVVVRWPAFFANTDLSNGLPHPIRSYVRRCGESIDGLTQACQLPQRATILKQLESVECRFDPEPRKPQGETARTAWEPQLEGTGLALAFGRGSDDMAKWVLAFLERRFPDPNKRDFDGETADEKAALDRAAAFRGHDFDEWKYVCKTPPPKVVTQRDGFSGGDPHRNKSTAVRLEDEAATYLRRCNGAGTSLRHLCNDEDLGARAKAVTQIDCRYVQTEDGYQKGPKDCAVKLSGTVLTATCGWYQSVSHRSVCEALGGGKLCIPEADGPAKVQARKKQTGEACASDDECALRTCRNGKCTYREVVQKKGRGEPCKHYGECQSHLSCLKGRCD